MNIRLFSIRSADALGCHVNLGRHTDSECYPHAYSMTTPIGEACGVCHGMNGEFAVNRVHAR